MNDYNLSIDPDRQKSAHLNGDTAVRWTLDVKQRLVDSTCSFLEEDGKVIALPFDDYGFEKLMFNITEDRNIDEHESDGTASRLLATRLEIQLLYEPLPADLPTVQKHALIAMAAYYGDVDRYARLRRPRKIWVETGCCVRGIYHYTFFPVWWSKQPGIKSSSIERAISARFIMNNVLSCVPFESNHAPCLIWWPTKAEPSTYRHLAKLQPDMLPQIIHACIYAEYQDLFDELLPQVTRDQVLLREARSKKHPHFLQALEKQAEMLGITPTYLHPSEDWKGYISSGFERSSDVVFKYFDVKDAGNGFDVPYDGIQCEFSSVETMVCLPRAWQLEAAERGGARLDYDEWSPSAVEEK